MLMRSGIIAICSRIYIDFVRNDFVIKSFALVVCSMQNWAEDLYFRELDLNYPGLSDAMVNLSPFQYILNHILLWLMFRLKSSSLNGCVVT